MARGRAGAAAVVRKKSAAAAATAAANQKHKKRRLASASSGLSDSEREREEKRRKKSEDESSSDVDTDDLPEYEVAAILDCRPQAGYQRQQVFRGNNRQRKRSHTYAPKGSGSDCEFLVKWKGYEKPTWEPRKHLTNVHALLAEFEEAQQQKRGASYLDDSSNSGTEREPSLRTPVSTRDSIRGGGGGNGDIVDRGSVDACSADDSGSGSGGNSVRRERVRGRERRVSGNDHGALHSDSVIAIEVEALPLPQQQQQLDEIQVVEPALQSSAGRGRGRGRPRGTGANAKRKAVESSSSAATGVQPGSATRLPRVARASGALRLAHQWRTQEFRGHAFSRELAALKRDVEESEEDGEHTVVGDLKPGLVGLKNLRNTCFANVIIQAFSRLESVRSFIRRSPLPKALMTQVMEVVEGIWQADSRVLTPRTLLSAVEAKYGHHFGQEEDAHWFLELLMQDFRDALAAESPKIAEQLPLLMRVASLPLLAGDGANEASEDTLANCLERWRGTADVLSWSPVGRHRDDKNGMSASQPWPSALALPCVYCFHFDRTRWTGRIISRGTRSAAKAKVTTRVRFPFMLSGEAISGSSRDSRAKYALVAMVVHDGLTPASGHYYVYLRQVDGSSINWFKIDDDKRPTAVLPETVEGDEPFLMFYEMVDAPRLVLD